MTPPVVPRASKEQVALKVVDRLKDTWVDISDDPNLEMALKRHLMRLPRRYALDIHNLEDLLSVSNSAYTRGTSAVELSHDMKVCAEYSLRRALYFGLTIADHEIFLMLYNVLSMKLL